MKTAETILLEWGCEEDNHCIDKECALSVMSEYAIEILQDYDNWKAHKTPELVKNYIKEKGL